MTPTLNRILFAIGNGLLTVFIGASVLADKVEWMPAEAKFGFALLALFGMGVKTYLTAPEK